MTLPRVYSWADFVTQKQPAIQFIVPQLLSFGGTLVLFGDAGIGKSWLGIDLVRAAANGTSWLGFPVTKCVPLLVQCEQPDQMFQDRMLTYTRGLSETMPDSAYIVNDMAVHLDNPHGKMKLEAYIAGCKCRPQLLVIDNYYSVVAESLNDDRAVKGFKDNVNDLRQKYGLAVVLLAHPRKAKVENGQPVDMGSDEAFGSRVLKDWTDTMMRMTECQPAMADTVILSFLKHRVSVVDLKSSPLRLHFDRQTVRFGII
jgi:RecA-family ATPase